MLIAEFQLGDALLTVLGIFLLIAWFWILISIVGDLFSDHDTSGWVKAGWVLLLLVLPFFGVLIYLIARGSSMRDRAIARQTDAQGQMDAYIRHTAGSSPADELSKLSDLKEKGTLSDAEFERAKAKLLG